MSFGDDTLDPVITYTEEQIIAGIELAQHWYEGHKFDEMDPRQITEAIQKSTYAPPGVFTVVKESE